MNISECISIIFHNFNSLYSFFALKIQLIKGTNRIKMNIFVAGRNASRFL